MSTKTLTQREEGAYDAAFAFWRMHMWLLRKGSYNEIEATVANGKLTPFICPRRFCDCKWPKKGAHAP